MNCVWMAGISIILYERAMWRGKKYLKKNIVREERMVGASMLCFEKEKISYLRSRFIMTQLIQNCNF